MFISIQILNNTFTPFGFEYFLDNLWLSMALPIYPVLHIYDLVFDKVTHKIGLLNKVDVQRSITEKGSY